MNFKFKSFFTYGNFWGIIHSLLLLQDQKMAFGSCFSSLMNEWMMKSQKTFTSKELQIIVILLLFHQIKLKFILYWPNLKFIINGAKQFSNLPPISRTRKWWPYCFPILNNSLAILIALSKLFSSRELEPTWNLQAK